MVDPFFFSFLVVFWVFSSVFGLFFLFFWWGVLVVFLFKCVCLVPQFCATEGLSLSWLFLDEPLNNMFSLGNPGL